jgi:arylsulfatase
MPTLPNPEFAGKTGNGDWADCLAEMDFRTGQVLDAIKEAGIEDNTIVIFEVVTIELGRQNAVRS